jgi:GT2 family glycosyltransferase
VSSLSVIIPVYRGGAAFGHCLTRLAADLPPATEVIIVIDGLDNGSAQQAQAFCQLWRSAQVIELPRNCGPAHARNVGAAAAHGDWLFFVDADVAIQADTIATLQQSCQQHPEIVAFIGSYDDAPGSPNFLSQYKNLLHHYTHQTGSSIASTFWGACGAIRRDVFLAMDGFDVAYRDPCVEDIELGYRLKRSGYQIRLCKQLQVKHLKRWTARSLLKADFLYRAVPWTELIWRDRSFVSDLNLDTSSRMSVVSVYGLLLGLLGGVIWSPMLGLVGLASLILLTLNRPVYQFFHHQRGLWFALRTIPWHWFYYAYSGLAFVVGTSKYFLNRPSPLPSRSASRSIAINSLPYDLVTTTVKH